MRIKNRILALELMITMVFTMLPASSITAGGTVSTQKLFQYSDADFRGGITVLPNGDIYAFVKKSNALYLTGFKENGTPNGIQVEMPMSECENIVSTKSGVIFSARYGKIYVFKPGRDTTVRTVAVDSAVIWLAIDPNDNLYKLGKVTYVDTGKQGAKISKIAASKVDALSEGAEVNWEKCYYPMYTPPSSSGNCFPKAIDVDQDGNAYIADMGHAEGAYGSVSGIYKYNLTTDKATVMSFSANKTLNLSWLYGINVDDYGNVAVLSRNGHSIALFRPGSTVADELVSVTGYVEDLDSDTNGNIYYISYGNVFAGNSIYKINMGNVAVTGMNLSITSKTIKVGNSFNLGATISPTNATNKIVNYSSSNSKVATVDSAGKVTGVGYGTAVISAISSQGRVKKTCTVKVLATKPAKAKILSVKNSAKKTAKIKWKKDNYAKYYQVQYKVKGGSYKYLKKKVTANTLTKKSLKKGKKYYFRVRAVAVGSKTLYGAWSAAKNVKITK